MARPNLLLLDANVVIEAYELGFWEKLIRTVTVTLPSIVARREAKYFTDSATGRTLDIRLEQLIADAVVREAAALPEEIAHLYHQFSADFISRIDPGEAEAIALLMAGHLPDHFFCTADGPAIEAIAMLGLSEQGISLEALLTSCGLTRRLRWFFSKRYFEHKLREGQQNRIAGMGLQPGSRYRL